MGVVTIGVALCSVAAAGYGLLLWKKMKVDVCSTLHTPKSAFNQHLILIIMKYLSGYFYKAFERDTQNCVQVQEQLLLKLLKDNENTEYGKAWKFSEIHSREEYQAKHPLTTYEHYLPYVERIEANVSDHNILSAYPLVKLAVSSGTSGSRKLIPFTKKHRGVFFFQGIAVIYHSLLNIPGMMCLQKTCKFMYNPTKRVAKSGITIGPNSSSPEDSKSMMDLFTTPAAGYLEINNEKTALYIHWLFALKDTNLGVFEANFVSAIFHAFRYLEKHWRSLCHDIETGTIQKDLPHISQETRRVLERKLGGPDAKRARFLIDQFEQGTEAIGIRIWPHLRCVLTTNTGSFAMYQTKLEHYIPTSIVPTFSPIYAATEGLIAINTNVGSGRYILLPKAMFLEFLPLTVENNDNNEVAEKTLFIDQLQVGQQYELIVTNHSGLHRFRMGDVVKVVDYHHKTPVIEFQYRLGQLLNVRGEKTSELAFQQAVLAVNWPSELVDFTSIDNLDDKPRDYDAPFYSVYVELTDYSKKIDIALLESALDEQLCKTNPVYLSYREKDSIGSPLINLVQPGTFMALRNAMIEAGTGVNQVKIPKVLRNASLISIMHDNVYAQ